MRSFPSSLNRGGNSATHLGKSEGSLDDNKTSADSNTVFSEDIERMSMYNYNLNNYVKKELLNESHINISENIDYINQLKLRADNNELEKEIIDTENPLHIPGSVFGHVNKYKMIYKKALETLYASGQTKGQTDGATILTTNTAVVQSMFNPQFMIQAVGMNDNTPLLNNAPSKTLIKRTNPTIKNLCGDSMKVNSDLGVGRFRYADFMFCKYLGQVPNNHLVVLRKFAHPIGDNIYKYAGPKYRNKKNPGKYDFSAEEDVSRLVTWFDTEDVKLEDLAKYDYSMSWKELKAERQWKPSKEDSSQRGVLGMLSNMNPQYNKLALGGFTGDNNIMSALGSKFGYHHVQSDNLEMLSDYDKNRVYTPINTVQDTNVYEGILHVNQEISLTFSYKLRAYDNMNPKSAMLDLIGNILETTYRRGHFWGGSKNILGPSPNPAAWKKANAFVDNSWDKLGGVMSGLTTGDFSFTEILGSVSNALTQIMASAVNGVRSMYGMTQSATAKDLQNNGTSAQTLNGIKPRNLANKAKNVAKGVGTAIQNPNATVGQGISGALKGLQSFDAKTGLSSGAKGALKDTLGRPAMYAFDSLLSGDNVGLWHLTIGNPYNPIISLGNLIMTGATVSQTGPLGIDDFPSEIKVTVKLKPGRSRDLTELSKMYTKGMGSLYLPVGGNKLSNYFPLYKNEEDIEMQVYKTMKAQREANAKADVAANKTIEATTAYNEQMSEQQETNANATQQQSPQAEKPSTMKNAKEYNTDIIDKFISESNVIPKSDLDMDSVAAGDRKYDMLAARAEIGLTSGVGLFRMQMPDRYGDSSVMFSLANMTSDKAKTK